MPIDFRPAAGQAVSSAPVSQEEAAFRTAGKMFNGFLGEGAQDGNSIGWGNVIMTAALGAYSIEEKGENPVFPLFNLLAAILGQFQGARAERREQLRQDITLAAEDRDHQEHARLASLGSSALEAAYEQPLQMEAPITVDGKERTSTFASGLYRFDASGDTEQVLRIFDRANDGYINIGLDGSEVWMQAGEERVAFETRHEPAYVRLDDGTTLVFATGEDGNAGVAVVKGPSAALVDAEGNVSEIAGSSALRAQVEQLYAQAHSADRGIQLADLRQSVGYQDDFELARQQLLGENAGRSPGDQGPEDKLALGGPRLAESPSEPDADQSG